MNMLEKDLRHDRESRAPVGRLGGGVPLPQGAAKIDDPEDEQEEHQGNDREFDRAHPAAVAEQASQLSNGASS